MNIGDGVEIQVVAEEKRAGRTPARLSVKRRAAAQLGDVIDRVKNDDGVAIEAAGLGGGLHLLEMIGWKLGGHQVADFHQPGPGFLQAAEREEFVKDIDDP